MERQWEFRYALPRPPEGELVELSAAEAENMLLKNVEEAKDDPQEALWELGRFYSSRKQHVKALDCLRKIMNRLPDAERKAACVLAMGQTMEQIQNYEAAIRYYREALALQSELRWSLSTLHSLFSRFEEPECFETQTLCLT